MEVWRAALCAHTVSLVISALDLGSGARRDAKLGNVEIADPEAVVLQIRIFVSWLPGFRENPKKRGQR